MRAAILAGGQGTRIRRLFPDLPKPMIPVAGKPLLAHQVSALAGQGITDITLIIGHQSAIIRDYFQEGGAFGVRIRYIVEKEPLGTGGALALLPKDDTLVLLGDVYLDVDFFRFISFHQERRAAVSLFAHPNSHPQDSDLLITDAYGRVTGWAPKKGNRTQDWRNLVNAGLYLFSREAMPVGAARNRDLERDLIFPRISGGRLFAYRSTEYIKDMGAPERLRDVERDIESGAARARNLNRRQKAVFLDRDGTINIDRGLIAAPEALTLIPGAAEAIRALNQSRFLSICVTNQPVVARGMVTLEGLDAIHARLDTLLGRAGAFLDDLLFCPHHPDRGYPEENPAYKMPCACRKPAPGMLLTAAERYHIDLSCSYIIGDSPADIEAGKAAGCLTVGIRTGGEPDYLCGNLREAVEWILEKEPLCDYS